MIHVHMYLHRNHNETLMRLVAHSHKNPLVYVVNKTNDLRNVCFVTDWKFRYCTMILFIYGTDAVRFDWVFFPNPRQTSKVLIEKNITKSLFATK